MPDYLVAQQARIARTFQNIRLFKSMTVLDNVMVGMHTKTKNRFLFAGRERNEAAGEAEELLKVFGLYDNRYEMAVSLPYGDQRKVEICRALASKPNLLLLDEPAAGMNEHETEELRNLVLQIRDMGNTILLIEHDLRFVMNICERLYVLNEGALICDGTADQVRSDPMVTEAYLGKDE